MNIWELNSEVDAIIHSTPVSCVLLYLTITKRSFFIIFKAIILIKADNQTNSRACFHWNSVVLWMLCEVLSFHSNFTYRGKNWMKGFGSVKIAHFDIFKWKSYTSLFWNGVLLLIFVFHIDVCDTFKKNNKKTTKRLKWKELISLELDTASCCRASSCQSFLELE